MAAALPRRWQLLLLGLALAVLLAAAPATEAWTGEIRGRVVCDVCGDAAIGPEDHALEGQLAPKLPHVPSCGYIDRPMFPSWVSCDRSSVYRVNCFRFQFARLSKYKPLSANFFDLGDFSQFLSFSFRLYFSFRFHFTSQVNGPICSILSCYTSRSSLLYHRCPPLTRRPPAPPHQQTL